MNMHSLLSLDDADSMDFCVTFSARGPALAPFTQTRLNHYLASLFGWVRLDSISVCCCCCLPWCGVLRRF